MPDASSAIMLFNLLAPFYRWREWHLKSRNDLESLCLSEIKRCKRHQLQTSLHLNWISSQMSPISGCSDPEFTHGTESCHLWKQHDLWLNSTDIVLKLSWNVPLSTIYSLVYLNSLDASQNGKIITPPPVMIIQIHNQSPESCKNLRAITTPLATKLTWKGVCVCAQVCVWSLSIPLSRSMPGYRNISAFDYRVLFWAHWECYVT